MSFMEEFCSLVPGSAADAIQWERIEKLLAEIGFAELEKVPQNPVYHGEGDVYAHTKMVCGELIRHPGYAELSDEHRAEIFLAAVLHDIGKAKTIRMEDGVWTSPRHSQVGSRIVREYLWRDCGLCGSREAMIFRETVCTLIRYHMLPVHLMDRQNPEKKVREIAAAGELASDFSWLLLCMLSESDVRGRIAGDTEDGLMQVRLAGMMAEEAGCLRGPCRFADSYTKRAYLSGRNVQPDQPLYNDSWGEVILMAGLPGTGKDTWIRERCPELPMISLDDIRREKKIRPTDDQGEVIQTAKERAKALLRKKQPFVWNATNLTADTRQKLICLFEQYGAGVRIVYLEADWDARIARNANRIHCVPEDAVGRMLEKTVPPMSNEAQTVEWQWV